MIREFQGPYRWLSNFWSAKVIFEGIEYPSVEHAYVAAKTTCMDTRRKIANMPSPGQAKREGRRLTLRANWDNIKLGVMEKLVYNKFANNPELKDKLLATGNELIQEGNRWNDKFWGVCLKTGEGENHLGRIIMEVREKTKGGITMIGITERGDAGLDFSWVDKLQLVNIIISKNLNDRLITELVKHQDKIIFHMTCTGFGGTMIEPNVPKRTYTLNQLDKLVSSGFPVSQIVFRVDPIFPTPKHLSTIALMLKYLKQSSSLDIRRVRYSFIDMYPHVRKRLTDKGIKVSWDTFTAPEDAVVTAIETLEKYGFELESCAEEGPHGVGCISKKDLDILGIKQRLTGSSSQRRDCLCPTQKLELLTGKTRCPHGCLYCYWKD